MLLRCCPYPVFIYPFLLPSGSLPSPRPSRPALCNSSAVSFSTSLISDSYSASARKQQNEYKSIYFCSCIAHVHYLVTYLITAYLDTNVFCSVIRQIMCVRSFNNLSISQPVTNLNNPHHMVFNTYTYTCLATVAEKLPFPPQRRTSHLGCSAVQSIGVKLNMPSSPVGLFIV